jgi:hypothetical protein
MASFTKLLVKIDVSFNDPTWFRNEAPWSEPGVHGVAKKHWLNGTS